MNGEAGGQVSVRIENTTPRPSTGRAVQRPAPIVVRNSQIPSPKNLQVGEMRRTAAVFECDGVRTHDALVTDADIGNEREKIKITNPEEANAGDAFSDHREKHFDRQLARCLLERCRFITAKWTYTETVETQSSNENSEVEYDDDKPNIYSVLPKEAAILASAWRWWRAYHDNRKQGDWRTYVNPAGARGACYAGSRETSSLRAFSTGSWYASLIRAPHSLSRFIPHLDEGRSSVYDADRYTAPVKCTGA